MMAATAKDPLLSVPSGDHSIPQLAFGLYKVPADEDGESIISEAIKAGYRHFDTATYYGNERTLGNALKSSGLSRDEFFVTSKVWNDAQKAGRAAVRNSVLQSIKELDFGDHIDLFLIHWPVPGRFVDTYKELEILHGEGKVRHIGLSNFSPAEYEELTSRENGITVPPAVNQFEVSPFMYRPCDVSYFQERGVLVSSSKSLHRGGDCLDNRLLKDVSDEHSATPAQIMLRWGMQKGLVVVCKTATPDRMAENRALFHFALSDDEMRALDGLTSEGDVAERERLEETRKRQM